MIHFVKQEWEMRQTHLVQNADISVHEDCNEELEFNERLVLISKSKAEFICFTSLVLIHFFNT